MTGVPLDPMPMHLMTGCRSVQSLPEILIGDGFSRCRFPTIFLPIGEPFGDSVFHINGIGKHMDGARTFQCRKPLNGSHQFHSIVGGFGITTDELFTMLAVLHQNTPATNAGISFACTVGIERDNLLSHSRV